MPKQFDMKAFREESGTQRNALLERLRSGSMEARPFTAAMSDLTDRNIRRLADHFLADHEGTVSLVFTGGNGREEIYPGSDLDILLLVPENMSENLSPELERDWSSFVTALWDAGYEPGAIVRTVNQCEEEALKDQTVWSSLLDRRLAWGSVGHFEDLTGTMTQLNETHWEKFLDEKLSESAERHKSKSDSRYFVQPDIKEGKGGLRDFHTMMWISQVVFDCDDVEDLAEEGLLSPAEAKRIQQAYDFLLEARCHLHDGKKTNHLTAENQPHIAGRVLHYDQDQRQQAIEEYMRRYFQYARDIGFLTNVVCAAALEKKAGFSAPVRHIGDFIIKGDKIHFGVEKPTPLQLLQIFRVAQQENAQVHPDALRQVRRNLKKFDDAAVQDPQTNKVFMEILTAKNKAAETLRKMQEAGVLPKFLPPMAGVDMKMQFDPYHAYTVDEETFQAIDRMHALEGDSLDKVAKVSGDIAGELSNSQRRILYTALLLHDAGKDIVETGDEEEHPLRGAEMVREYGPRLGLTKAETQKAAWLVENHLLLSHTALRRDLADPWTAEMFAQKVGSEKNLELLTALTTADIMGNSPAAWEPNVAVRIASLYHRAKAHMRSEKFEPPASLQDEGESGATRVSLSQSFARNATVVDVVTPQKHRVFERLTALLASKGANIVGLDYEANGDGSTARSHILIQSESGNMFEENRHESLQKGIEEGLQDEAVLDITVPDQAKFGSAKVIPYRFAPEVELSNDFSAQCTIIDVTAPDRPSLLNNVAKVFNAHGLELKHARVTSYGKSFKAHDTFYVIDRETGAQIDPERFEEIRQALLESPALRAFE